MAAFPCPPPATSWRLEPQPTVRPRSQAVHLVATKKQRTATSAKTQVTSEQIAQGYRVYAAQERDTHGAAARHPPGQCASSVASSVTTGRIVLVLFLVRDVRHAAGPAMAIQTTRITVSTVPAPRYFWYARRVPTVDTGHGTVQQSLLSMPGGEVSVSVKTAENLGMCLLIVRLYVRLYSYFTCCRYF